MANPVKHIFICTNQRDSDSPKGCCAAKGSSDMRDYLKSKVKEHAMQGKIQISKSGCLGPCAKGTIMVVYPDGIWYQGVQKEDLDEIFESHLLNNQPVKRLSFTR